MLCITWSFPPPITQYTKHESLIYWCHIQVPDKDQTIKEVEWMIFTMQVPVNELLL